MAIRIGDLLVQNGVITATQLEEGLRAQQTFGGRLGTNLVELGFLSEQALAQFLSSQLKLPCIEVHEVENITEEVLKQVPHAIAEKYRVVPLALDKRRLRLAMTDPTDLKAVDEVSFSTGLTVVPVVTPDLLITYALEKYYGVRRATRYIRVTGASQAEFQVVQSAQQAGKGGGRVQVEDRGEFMQQERKEFKTETYSWHRAVKDLSEIQEQAEAFAVFLKFAAQDFEKALVLATRGPALVGWRQQGGPISDDQLRQVSFAATDCPTIHGLMASQKSLAGPMPHGRIEDWLLQVMGVHDRKNCLVLPVVANNQSVAVLLGFEPTQGELTDQPATYDDFARRMGYALQMVFFKKRIVAS